MAYEKIFISLASTLLVAVALIGPSNGLQCYSCATDTSDLDCDDLSVLPKVDCTPFSTSHPVQPVCGYQRLAASTGEESERIWRGCAIGGQCALLSQQGDAAYNSVFTLSVCEECSTDNCNGQSSGGAIVGPGRAPWMIVMLIGATLITLN